MNGLMPFSGFWCAATSSGILRMSSSSRSRATASIQYEIERQGAAKAEARQRARDLIAMVNLAAASLNPLLMAVHSVPKAALMPIIMLWLGIGDAPKLLVIRWAWLYRLFITIQVNSDSLRRIPVEL
jgi:hypothetical protein